MDNSFPLIYKIIICAVAISVGFGFFCCPSRHDSFFIRTKKLFKNQHDDDDDDDDDNSNIRSDSNTRIIPYAANKDVSNHRQSTSSRAVTDGDLIDRHRANMDAILKSAHEDAENIVRKIADDFRARNPHLQVRKTHGLINSSTGRENSDPIIEEITDLPQAEIEFKRS